MIYESEKVRPQRFASPENTARSQKTMDFLPEIHKLGMTPEEVGEKVLAGIRRNDMYIFSHPEFREEMQEIHDEILRYLPEEEAPAGRLAFEKTRRDSLRTAKDEANKIG
jgi:hypothetical protein